MRTLIPFTVTLTLTSFVLVGLITLLSRTRPLPTYDPLPADYALGHAPPHPLCCCYSFSYYDWPYLECQPSKTVGSTEVWVSYNANTQQITHLTVMAPGKKVGDLIAAWGPPIGYKNANTCHYMYWPNRYAYSCATNRSRMAGLTLWLYRTMGLVALSQDTGWTPTSGVGFIAYDTAVPVMDPWRGFRNH